MLPSTPSQLGPCQLLTSQLDAMQLLQPLYVGTAADQGYASTGDHDVLP